MEGIKVAIERHKGFRSTGFGTQAEFDLGQWRVRVNGKIAGYVADESASHISLLGTYSETPKEVVDYIKSEVDRLRGVVAPTIVQAVDFQSANVKVAEVEDEPLS